MTQTQSPRRGILAERDPYSRLIEVWHRGHNGDLRELVIEIDKDAPQAHIAKEIREKGRLWIDWLGKQGFSVDGRTVLPHGPYPCVEADKLGMQNWVVSALVKRTKPEIRKLVDFEELTENAPTPGGVRQIFEGAGSPAEIERNARERVEADRQIGQARAGWAEMERDRRIRGLPAFRPEIPHELLQD